MKTESVIKTVVAIVIGAVLYFVLFRFTSIDTPVENTSINFGIAIPAAFAAIFGPVAGFLIGFIGHVLTDFSYVLIDSSGEAKIWWSWVISSGVFGCIIGLFWKSYKVEDGGFGLKQCLAFNGIQIVANVLVWVFLARTLDMVIYSEAFDKVSLQSFAAALFNSVVVLVIGSLIILVYSKIISKKGSTKTEA
ncbi:MAG: ECF-type riboflavin transporter substrate-binding protein [Treponema sp.]|jgi:energy-coupling factor transport system substrate-specific component|nr:ECF-type riboflavin transporter substrate-binding protein [Treponema sp.]